jgi:hypothetical protein
MNQPLLAEAKLFANYLGATNGDDALVGRYVNAIELLQLPLSTKEAVVLNKLIQMPFLLALIDGGYALLQPNNTIRKRILVMSALMETEPKYVNRFLVQQNISFPIIKFLYRGSVAVAKGVTGAVLIIIFRWK